MALNIQEMAASAYQIITQLQSTATEMAGLDCLWARATPQVNSEDVILQEYTLSNVGLECPQTIKVLTTNTEYNPGNFTVDLFGINYDAPLEVHVTISDWNRIFGEDTTPQKGDIVYVKLLHKLFEVSTSQTIYQIASMPTYFKCQLSKYNPVASRRETEEFKLSIDELTVSQEELFGDTISQEVADVVNTVETAYNTTSCVDPLKDYDMYSIVATTVHGPNGNLITHSYYDFAKAKNNITYHVSAKYPGNEERLHWIYSCWFREEEKQVETGKVIKMNYYTKDKSFWYFTITCTLDLEIGDEVTIVRGNNIKVLGVITQLNCEEGFGVQIKYSEMTKANRKLTEWWNFRNLKIYKSRHFNFLTGYNGEEKVIDIKYSDIIKKLTIKFNNVESDFFLTYLNLSDWNYLTFDICKDSLRVIVYDNKYDAINIVHAHEIFDETQHIALKDFEISEFRIEDLYTGLQICNIRLYENEFEIGDTFRKEMYDIISRNASKLILVDNPNIPESNFFQSPVR